MNTLIFSQTAIFRLQRLGAQYYHYTGERHRLADEHGILDLLQNSALINDHRVRGAYEAFINELEKPQIEALVERGVRLRHSYRLH
jgi:hypothetical protein